MNTKIVAAAFVASLSLTWGIPSFSDYLRNAFFWKEIAENPEIVAAFAKQADLERQFLEAAPLSRATSKVPSLESRAAFSVLVRKDGSEKVLFAKNENEAVPIASLAKLMTALVAIQTYPLDERIGMSAKAVATEGAQGDFSEGQVFTVRDLLYPLLMESSNDAAAALAQHKGESSFVRLMNGTAEILHMSQTRFFNPTGLDPAQGNDVNVSSARDLAALVEYLRESKPEVFDILSLKEFDLRDANEQPHHKILNTNELLQDHELQTRVLGGKTGYTEKAKGCLIIILQSPKDRGYIVNVILGSDDRFEEMKELIQFTYEGYVW